MRETQPTNRRGSFWAGCPSPTVTLLGLTLLVVGCTQSQPSQTRKAYFVKVKDGHVVFTVGKLDLVLEGMEPKAGLQSTGWLTVPNRGASGSGMQSANGVTAGATLRFATTLFDGRLGASEILCRALFFLNSSNRHRCSFLRSHSCLTAFLCSRNLDSLSSSIRSSTLWAIC